MNIKQIEKILTEGGIEPNEARIEAKMLVKHFLGLSDVDLAMNEEFDDEKGQEVVEKARIRAEKRIPIQHIIGVAYFMGEDFIVNEHVLIPRDETEILVRKAVEILNAKRKVQSADEKARGQEDKRASSQKQENLSTHRLIDSSPNYSPVHPFTYSPLSVLDIGTGSGCIACMIAKLTDAQVVGVDVSSEALSTALDNSSKMGLFNKAIFRKSNLFSNIRKDGFGSEKYDLIVSNPPYIPLSEKENLQVEVKFEPEGALFAPDEFGIEFYDKIVKEAPEYLKDGGHLMFELGIGQAQKVKELMENAGFENIQIEKDLAGIERIIVGSR